MKMIIVIGIREKENFMDEKNELIVIKENKNKSINYITVLSVISAIAVVILHTKGQVEIFSRAQYWMNNNIIECIFHFAVPIFFMISGATLIDYRERYSTKEFLKKRFKKTVIPFICWSIIGILYQDFRKNNLDIQHLTITQILNNILGAKSVHVYWFFPKLFSVYLCMPLFSAIEKKLKKKVFIYILIVCIIFNCIIPFINNVYEQNLILPITIHVGGGYLLYIIIGYLINTNKIDRRIEAVIYILGIIGLLLQIFGTYSLSMEKGRFVGTYKGYENLPCILYSVAIFLLVKNICEKIKSEKFYLIINKIKKYTFSIYLIHWFIIDFINDTVKLDTNSMIYIFGIPVIVILLCIAITYLLRKIPIIRHIVPE